MKSMFFPCVAAALAFVAAQGAVGQDDHTLIAQVAAEQPAAAAAATAPVARTATPAGAPAPAADLDRREHQARVEVFVAQMRLEMVLARKALRAGDHTAAARHALRVLRYVAALPPRYDASAFALMAEGIVARAEKAGVDVAALRKTSGGKVQPPARNTAAHAAEPPAADTPPDTGAGIAADAASPAPGGLRPAADGNIYYPADWPAKIARRARYRGGQIARSKSWIDDGGREWYAAVYDVHDLIYVPPDFGPYLSLDSSENLRTITDRNAFWTYGGTLGFWDPGRVAQSIAVLDYFGGVDPYARRGPKYSVERERRIADMIEAFSTQKTQSEVIILEP